MLYMDEVSLGSGMSEVIISKKSLRQERKGGKSP
jgi:hypothetical protein